MSGIIKMSKLIHGGSGCPWFGQAWSEHVMGHWGSLSEHFPPNCGCTSRCWERGQLQFNADGPKTLVFPFWLALGYSCCFAGSIKAVCCWDKQVRPHPRDSVFMPLVRALCDCGSSVYRSPNTVVLHPLRAACYLSPPSGGPPLCLAVWWGCGHCIQYTTLGNELTEGYKTSQHDHFGKYFHIQLWFLWNDTE